VIDIWSPGSVGLLPDPIAEPNKGGESIDFSVVILNACGTLPTTMNVRCTGTPTVRFSVGAGLDSIVSGVKPNPYAVAEIIPPYKVMFIVVGDVVGVGVGVEVGVGEVDGVGVTVGVGIGEVVGVSVGDILGVGKGETVGVGAV
jgi:hypothetical protein